MEGKMKKKKPSKFWKFISRYPVFMTIFIAVPVISSLLASSVSDYVFDNLYYDGQQINFSDISTFELTGIEKKLKVVDTTIYHNYQGGTCYQNYYLLCSNNFETIVIYDMNKEKIYNIIYTEQNNTEYHCNTCFFGQDFYSASDQFPILYISMENASVHSTIGYRINLSNGNKMEEVCCITLNSDLYFPNSYYDYESGLLYYSGYTKNSYMKEEDNYLTYYSFLMPDYRKSKVTLTPDDAIETFNLPSETATQGGFISHNHLFQTFSFHYSNNPLKAPKMRVVDLYKHEVVKDYQDLGKQLGIYDEFENIAISESGKLYSFGNKGFNIYEFLYKV